MKQIIGYMEYDYMNMKRGMWFTMALFTAISVIFSFRSAVMTVGYMLFGALVLTSTMFVKAVQTVSFDALVPGSTLQKVAARYLGSFLIIAVSGLTGLLIVSVMKIAGFTDAGIDIQLIAAVGGIALFLLAVQNLAFYALLPLMGVQFVNLIRLVPGFILFFGVMNETTQEIISGFLRYNDSPGFIILGIGAASMFAGVFVSWLVIRGRDGE